ncbi:MAG: uroporphyrinogen-III synthase, partial [Nitrospiraceae bacterium]
MNKSEQGFNGLRVAAFESRMADEMARLITRYGGQPLVAPSMRVIPLQDNTEVLSFGEQLLARQFDMVILLTGVGTRTMVQVLQTR